MATALAQRKDGGRTDFGLPARRRTPLAILGWIVVLLAAGLTMGWRALRWADRNL
ncbi:MAG: hypothetical protein ACRDF5_08730 [bacterium]